MKITVIPIFKFLRILSVVCFGVFGMIHVISLIAPDLLVPLRTGIMISTLSTFAVLMVSFSIVHDANPKIRELKFRNIFTYQFSGDYYRAAYGPLWKFTPFWAKLAAAGLFAYELIYFFAMRQVDFASAADFAAGNMRYTTTWVTPFYWVSIWLWHAEIRRREPVQDDLGAIVS